MLTEQDIVLAQKRVSDDNLIRSIEKDYPNLFYVSIFANDNFEETHSKDLDTLFYIAQNDTSGAEWILEVTKWLFNEPFVVQRNQDGIFALDLSQINPRRLHQLFWNIDSLTDRNINTEVSNYLALLKFGAMHHLYLKLGQ